MTNTRLLSLLSLTALAGIAIGGAVTGGYFLQNPVTETEYETVTETETVVDTGTQFMYQPAPCMNGFEKPFTVEYQYLVDENYTTHYSVRTEKNEWHTVELVPERRYRIVVENNVGEKRMIGAFTNTETQDRYVIEVGDCGY